jgi:hypothetical protein
VWLASVCLAVDSAFGQICDRERDNWRPGAADTPGSAPRETLRADRDDDSYLRAFMGAFNPGKRLSPWRPPMPMFKCPKCGILAQYHNNADGSFSPGPVRISDQLANCPEGNDRLKVKDPAEQFFCPVIAKEASRLRNLRSG